MLNKIEMFVKLVENDQLENLKAQNFNSEVNIRNCKVTYDVRRKYILVDIKNSGRYMIDKETQEIYGIKAYGKINKNHYYGILDTISNYYWGQYTAFKMKEVRDINNIEFLTVESVLEQKKVDEMMAKFEKEVIDAEELSFEEIAEEYSQQQNNCENIIVVDFNNSNVEEIEEVQEMKEVVNSSLINTFNTEPRTKENNKTIEVNSNMKIECLEGHTLKEKNISFESAIDMIILKLSDKVPFVKTVFEIPCIKGIGLHNVTSWDVENINYNFYNDNFIVSDGKNSLSLNKDANITIRDRKNMSYTFSVYFHDYNMSFVIGY